LWFHIDGDRGASFWDNGTSYEELLGLGISYIPELPYSNFFSTQGSYRIKRIDHNGKVANIMQQNENGPCPLIAIANILALRGCITIDGKHDRIMVESVVERISKYLKTQNENSNEEEKKIVDAGIKTIADLQVGLDVNFGFMKCDSFEPTIKGKIFDLLKIKMVHGWLVEPTTKAAEVIGNATYNDLTLQLAALNEKMESMQENKETKDEKEKILTPEEGDVVSDFLSKTSHQLTDYGLQKLHETLQEDELVVFFRNNHFSTLTKHKNQLFNLVTDIGYERERLIVWDLLASVDGNSCFYSSEFSNTNEVKNEEIVNTAILCGFYKERVDEAIAALTKPNEELKTDDVLAWLSKRYPL